MEMLKSHPSNSQEKRKLLVAGEKANRKCGHNVFLARLLCSWRKESTVAESHSLEYREEGGGEHDYRFLNRAPLGERNFC
jgi:hypothetical protein